MTELASLPFSVGDRVAGKYRIERVLGRGGMGVVVAAMHEELDERVALKFLLREVAEVPELVQRFVREARAAVKIRSEHVARVLDVGRLESGTPYMVMEYLEGEDLSQVVAARGPLPVADAVGYVLQACEAIAEAHALGTVHRDLKPANLFLARRPSGAPIVKVLDFGISKVAASAKEANLTQTTTMMGSPSYMSPEQMVSAGTVDLRADVWALGVVLYELFTQRLPFAASTMPELVGLILQTRHEPVAALRADVPATLSAVVDRCLEKDRVRRYSNLAELAAALVPFGPPRAEQSLERISHTLGLAATMPMQSGQTLVAPQLTAEGQTFSPVMVASAAQGRGRRWLVPGAVLVALAAAVGVVVQRGRVNPAVQPTAATVTTSTTAAAALTTLTTAPEAPPAPERPVVPAAPPAGSTVSAVTVAPLPVATVVAGPARPIAPVHPRAAPPAASSSAAPACRTVSFFDADGNRHFRQECP